MVSPTGPTPGDWLQRYCPLLDGQFVFLNPLSWETHLLTESAMLVLREAAASIEEDRFDAFLDEVAEAGGWPPELEFLARSLTTLVVREREARQ